jgi:hypothetical protein
LGCAANSNVKKVQHSRSATINSTATATDFVYAGDTVVLSHHLDGMLLVFHRKLLLLSLLLPLPLLAHADRRPAPRTSRQKTRTPMPRIYNLGGRPALAAVT